MNHHSYVGLQGLPVSRMRGMHEAAITLVGERIFMPHTKELITPRTACSRSLSAALQLFSIVFGPVLNELLL